jgi:hypothetical protein
VVGTDDPIRGAEKEKRGLGVVERLQATERTTEARKKLALDKRGAESVITERDP